MNAIVNLIAYQVVWFAAVIGAGRGLTWPGVAAVAVFAAWRFALSRQRWVELRLIAVALLLGVLLDSASAMSGWLRYATPSPALPAGGAPVWILALWVALALTITQTFAFLRGRPWLAALLGLIGTPLAYLAAARGWHVVDFTAPTWRALALIGIGWAIALPLLIGLARYGSQRADITQLATPRSAA